MVTRERCLDALARAGAHVPLILVLFADGLPGLRPHGCRGGHGIGRNCVLDTADKGSGSLCPSSDPRRLFSFVTQARAHGLTVGLAGSLTAADVPVLLPLAPI